MSKVCKIENCDRLIRAKGYCGSHYNQLARPFKPCSIEGCNNSIAGRKLCKYHYNQAEKIGFNGFDKISREEYFKEKYYVDNDTGCWIWTGSISGDSYGYISNGKKMVKAHRFSYERFVGTIPEGLVVCHRCDNTICINPEHLFVGTIQDNMDDMKQKGRSNKLFGQNHNQAKLTDVQVLEIRKRISRGESGVSLARFFNVTPQMISLIKSGRYWKHLL